MNSLAVCLISVDVESALIKAVPMIAPFECGKTAWNVDLSRIPNPTRIGFFNS